MCSIHPRDKQDVAYRLTLGARAVAYNEKDVAFLGPFPKQILYTPMHVKITYDQAVAVKSSQDVFEVINTDSGRLVLTSLLVKPATASSK